MKCCSMEAYIDAIQVLLITLLLFTSKCMCIVAEEFQNGYVQSGLTNLHVHYFANITTIHVIQREGCCGGFIFYLLSGCFWKL